MDRGKDSIRHPDYAGAVASFRLEDALDELQGNLRDGLNACVECCDRHCGGSRLALRWIALDGHLETLTFEQLRDMSARVAHMLAAAGVGPGDIVAGMLPRTPELIATILGTWRAGAVYKPLFTAFGPRSIEDRLRGCLARLVITNSANRGKFAGVSNCPPVVTLVEPGDTLVDGDMDFRAAIRAASTHLKPVMRSAADLLMMTSTSGTTGFPRNVPVPMRALPAIAVYMRTGIDLRPDDVFWNIADPGWAYGLYYGVTGPLLLGQAMTFFEGGFSAESLCAIIKRLHVTNLAGSPTAFRMLMAAPPQIIEPIRGLLRVVSSAGEPLNPEVIRWFDQVLGAPIRDHYGLTETGMVVNNHHGLQHPVRPGSMGHAMPGYRVAVLDGTGQELGPHQPGVLAIDVARSPLLWFTGYHHEDTPAIAGGYFRTGDNVELAADGSISFLGRSDDMIKTSGYRIGPFDVESVLVEHPAVIEAAVIGIPDPQRNEIIKAFVILADGVAGSSELAEALRLHVYNRLSAHAYPREIEFVTELPKTPSGKLQRFLLRRAEAAKPAREH